MELSQDGKIIILEMTDIGGTNTSAVGNWATWQSVANFHHITAVVEIGTWNAGDDLDQCKLQQYDGTTTKDLTTSASGGDYDTDAPLDADGDQVIFEVPVSRLDAANGFNRVRVYVAEVGNTGPDNISGTLILHHARDKKENLHKTAVTGEIVYVHRA